MLGKWWEGVMCEIKDMYRYTQIDRDTTTTVGDAFFCM